MLEFSVILRAVLHHFLVFPGINVVSQTTSKHILWEQLLQPFQKAIAGPAKTYSDQVGKLIITRQWKLQLGPPTLIV